MKNDGMSNSWDDNISNIWKNKFHVPNHQPAMMKEHFGWVHRTRSVIFRGKHWLTVQILPIPQSVHPWHLVLAGS